jgi:ankyrin repeat protein
MLNEEYNQRPESELIFEKIADGDLTYVNAYIAHRADLEVCSPDGNSLLFYSIFCDKNDIAGILIPAVSLEQVANTFVLLSGLNHHALLHKLFPLVEENKPDLIDGLLAACKFNRIDNVEFLLDSGKVTALDQDKEGKTALMWAAGSKSNSNELFDLLLSHGADINHKDILGNSVLKSAFSSLWRPLSDTYSPDFAKIRWLLDKGAIISEDDCVAAGFSDNPMLIAMIEDHIEKSKSYGDIAEALAGITLEDFDSPMSDDNTTCIGDHFGRNSEI